MLIDYLQERLGQDWKYVYNTQDFPEVLDDYYQDYSEDDEVDTF